MTTWTRQTKNTSSFSTQARSTSSFTNQSKGVEGAVIAAAGQAIGLLLALTYSGGQILSAGILPVWGNQTKS